MSHSCTSVGEASSTTMPTLGPGTSWLDHGLLGDSGLLEWIMINYSTHRWPCQDTTGDILQNNSSRNFTEESQNHGSWESSNDIIAASLGTRHSAKWPSLDTKWRLPDSLIAMNKICHIHHFTLLTVIYMTVTSQRVSVMLA